jgi:uncharacterized protein YbjT (DUF2867 family)
MHHILLTGATGYVGGRLLPVLLDRGHPVRCLTRRPERASLPAGAEAVRGDVLDPGSLHDAFQGIDVAYYMVHSMEGSGDFAARDREGARNFARAAKAAGVRRVVYLGGLAGDSKHLRSREEVAELLAALGPPLVHVRAAMVIGDGSASFTMLRSLVDRLPVMVTPKWVDTRTQPVAARDVVGVLAALADREDAPQEVQVGGADVLTYGEMLRRYARVAGRRPPRFVKVPVLTPKLSSYWVGLVTPVDPALARPLVEGLSAEMLVDTPPPPGLNDDPLGFEDAVREALA